MLIVTTETIQGREPEMLGLVRVSTIRTVSAFRDIGADAIVCARCAASAVMQSAAEATAYGTAVRFR